MEACGGGVGSSTGTRVPEMILEDPASGIAAEGERSQEPATVRVRGEVSEEIVAETTWAEDISLACRANGGGDGSRLQS